MRKLAYSGVLMLLLLIQACINDINDTDGASKSPTSTSIFIEKDDIEFANKAAVIGLNEIELGKLAIKKGSDKKIKNFGTMLIKQHTKTGRKLTVVAQSKKLTLPLAPDTVILNDINTLSKLSGKAFDKAYIAYITTNHQKNLELFEQAAKHVYDKDIRKIANRDVLILKRHLYALHGISAMMR